MCEELRDELDNSVRLATGLVDHLTAMGGAGQCVIPVHDRAGEWVVVVLPRERWDALNSPERRSSNDEA